MTELPRRMNTVCKSSGSERLADPSRTITATPRLRGFRRRLTANRPGPGSATVCWHPMNSCFGAERRNGLEGPWYYVF